jgi:putative transposase
MQIQRTVTITLEYDGDLKRTLEVFQRIQQQLSVPCYNNGKPLPALALYREYYHEVKGVLNAQMTCTAIRLVAGAYAAAKSNKKPATRPFLFKKLRALFLVGKKGRDASFREDGRLSIWTCAGRKQLAYQVPKDFKPVLAQASEIDSLIVIERNGKLIGRVTVTLEIAKPQGILPVGIDLNETNALVAVDPDGRTFFISGKAVKVKNRRTSKTRSRLQKKHAARKAHKKDTRSVRRLLKRLGRTQRNRTRTFAQQTAKQLVEWAPKNAVLVFEALHIPKPEKGKLRGRALRRRLSLWQHALIRICAQNKAQENGMKVAQVNPAYTSKNCSRCGLRGVRKRHTFTCPHCGHSDHADINAAYNIRNRFTQFRLSGLSSISPEALSLSQDEGKPPSLGGGH